MVVSVAVLVVGGACAAFALLPAAVPAAAAPSDDFVTVWNATGDDRTIRIPVGGATGTYTIDWGDGSTSTGVRGDQEHTYAQEDWYTVRISGDFTRIFLGGDPENARKLLSIEQWGSAQWSSMESAFAGTRIMEYNAEDYPDLSGVSSMSGMFSSAHNIRANFSAWDTSSVTDMSHMFSNTYDIGIRTYGWDTSSVTDMSHMFSGSSTFYTDASAWDTSSVTDMSYMFYNGSWIGPSLSYWDTSSVTDMSYMFYGYDVYEDLSGFDTSSVTDMSYMFYETRYFAGLSAWDTSSVTDMSHMFYGSGTESDISAWDTSSVTDMSYMLIYANVGGDISRWDTSSVTNMSHMLYGGDVYANLSNWDTSKVTDMSGMLSYAFFSTDANISGWDTSSVTNMSRMFFDTTYFSYEDLSGWDTSKVTDMSWMFSNLFYLNPNFSGWDTSSVTDMSGMFYNVYDPTIDLSGWDTSSVTDMSDMFFRVNFYSNFSGWDTSSVTNMSGMFDTSGFNPDRTDLSGWDTSSVTDMSHMFSDAGRFNGDLSGWDTSSVTDMSHMFHGAWNFHSDLSAWDTSSVTDMSHMFHVTYLNSDLSGWDTSSVTDMSGMFESAYYFNSDLSGWDTSKVTDMSTMFYSAPRFSSDLSRWDTSSVTDMGYMFSSADSFSFNLSGWDVSNVANMYRMFDDDAFDQNQNLGHWYIIPNSTRVGGDGTYAAEITAQNSALLDLSPYRIYYLVNDDAYPDNENFTLSGDYNHVLTLKPDAPVKDTYLVSIEALYFPFGADNARQFEITTSSSPNRPPAADAGADQTVPEGSTVRLDGSSSSDPDNDSLSYLWVAPQGVTLLNDNAAASSFAAPSVTADANYTITLAVSDGVATDTDTVVVTVRQVNQAPAADAGADQSVPEGATVTLDGSGSSDPDGDAMTYSWTAPQGITLQGASTAAPSFAAPSVSSDTDYTFTLAVSDGTLSDTDTVVVTVRQVNQAPTADAGADQSVPEGATVTLDGSGSSDPDGDAMTYSWTAPQGVTLLNDNTAAPSFAAPSVTSDTDYTFTLAVSDGTLSDTDTVVVTVRQVNQAPTADAGADKAASESTTVTLDGSGSSDPDGDAMTYSWTAPQGITLQNANTAAPSFAAPSVTSDTQHTFTLAVSDGTLSDTDTVVVTVRQVNQAPTADAGADKAASESTTVTLDGSGSSDPDGDTMTYSWTAPQGITLQNANTAAPSFAAPSVTSDTQHTFTLAVSDGTLSDTDTVVVTVRQVNQAPTADAGADQSVPEGATVTLDGSGSSDPDGDAMTYSWTAPQGITLQNANTAAPSFAAPSVTSDTQHTFTLAVSDGTLSDTDTVVVTVRNASAPPLPNRAPVADAGNGLTVPEGATVHLNGFASSDPDGDAITYVWTISPSVTLKNADTPAPSFTAPGVASDTDYTLTLTVSDGTDTATDTVVVTVKNNLQPVADAGSALTAREGATVHLNGFASSDPDGDSITYDWTISPSVTLKNANTAAPSFTAPSVSSDTDYTLTLTVSDGTDTATDTVVVTVKNNLQPVADAGQNLTVQEGATVHLNGFASSDPDGDSITYDWTISPSVTLKNADTPAPSFTAPSVESDTTYTLTLTVSDGTDTTTDTVVVTVRNAPAQ